MPLKQDEETKRYLLSQYSPKLMGDLTPGTSDQIAPAAITNSVSSPTPETPISEVPTSTGVEVSDIGNDERIEDSHPGHKPDELLNYIKGQEGQVDKYGPDQEKALFDQINKSQGSIGNRLARGATGLGDAIMSVAGKQSPGFLNSLETRQANENSTALNMVPALQKMNAENMGEKQKLESMSSGTPLGESQIAPLAAFFERVGVPAKEIPGLLKNPAAARGVIDAFAQVMTKEEQIKMETLLKQLELKQQTTNQQQQRDIEKERNRQNALQELKKYGPVDRTLLHRSEAKALQEIANPPEKESTGPLGSETVKNGKTYVWSPTTGKYHPK